MTHPTPPHVAALVDVPLDRRPLLLDLIFDAADRGPVTADDMQRLAGLVVAR